MINNKYTSSGRLELFYNDIFDAWLVLVLKKLHVHTYYHSSIQSKEITTVSKDMSVSSLGAKINSEENSPPLPEFSNCYFEKLWWYLALWPQNTNTITSKIRGKSRSVIDSQSCDTWKMKWLYVFISISSVLVKVSQSLPDIIKIGKSRF